MIRILAPGLGLTLLVSLSAADVLTGTVVDALGNPVPGVNLDVEDLAGQDVDPQDDFTDATGRFTTLVPPGVYRVIFHPPVPPTTTHLSRAIENVVVVGTADLGTVVLARGVRVTGRLVDPGGLPVGDADIDAVDLVTDTDALLQSDNVDAFGNFSLAVPPNLLLQFEPRPPLVGQAYAPRELELHLSGDSDLGNVVVQPGVRVTGRVTDTTGAAAVNVDFDVLDPVTGEELYTPGDNTDGSGNFRLLIPAGTWDFEVCPPPGVALLATRAGSIPVPGDVNVGTLVLSPGFRMSGRVTDCAGRPVEGVDVDSIRLPGLTAVFLCHDSTDELGNYAVVVPPGSQAVVFRHPVLGTDVITGLSPTADFVQDGGLDCCPPGSVTSRNGGGSNPVLYQSTTPPGIGDPWSATIDTTGFPAGVLALVGYAGPGAGIVIPGSGEVLIDHLSPRVFLQVLPHAGGPTAIGMTLPDSLELCGAFVATQALVFGGPTPVFTNALDLVVGE